MVLLVLFVSLLSSCVGPFSGCKVDENVGDEYGEAWSHEFLNGEDDGEVEEEEEDEEDDDEDDEEDDDEDDEDDEDIWGLMISRKLLDAAIIFCIRS